LKHKSSILFFVVLFICFKSFATNTSLIAKHIKVSVDNETGSFVFYGRKTTKDNWKPLLFNDVPPTTYFRFYQDNMRLPFGEGGGIYYSEINIKNNKIYYYWKDDKIKISTEYLLFASEKDALFDSLEVALKTENLTKDTTLLNFFLCIDTYLGEKSDNHFILPGNLTINKESEKYKSYLPSSITSSGENNMYGVNILFNLQDKVKPDRVFFANWKRIDNSIGLFKTKEDRNFSLEPYSIDDSAVFIEYRNQELSYSKQKSEYKFLFSLNSEFKYDILKEEEPKINAKDQSKIVEFDKSPKQKETSLDLTNLSLSDLLKLLDEINKKLDSGESITQGDIDYADQILNEIEKR